MGVMMLKPIEPRNHRCLRSVRDEKLEDLMMITGGNHQNCLSAMRDERKVLAT